MPVIKASTAPSYALPGLIFTPLAAPSLGALHTCLWRISMAPGTAGTEHSVDKEEIFHALLGQAEITLGTDHCVLHAGDTFVVPPGKTFALSNLSDKTFEAIAIAPAGVRAHMPSGEPFAPPWTL